MLSALWGHLKGSYNAFIVLYDSTHLDILIKSQNIIGVVYAESLVLNKQH